MYIFIRIILMVIVILIFYPKLKKNLPDNRMKREFLIVITVMILYYILIPIHFENVVVKFHSPKDAFEYMHFNKKIIKIIEDDNCAFIIYGEDGSSFSFTAIEKRDGVWMVASSDISVTFKNINRYQITVCNMKQCNKKLVCLCDVNNTEPHRNIEISDNKNSRFETFCSKYEIVDYYTIFYYTVIDSNSTGYQLTVNGQSISLK